MAGRGTDIMLGGNPEFIAAAELRNRGLSPVDTPQEYEAAWAQALTDAEAAVKAEHDEVVEAGGLYVLGTERHESRRIDNQLRGRSGRQGDPGLSKFYLSLGDDLMRLFNASAVEGIMDRLNIPEDVPIESKMVSRAIRSAQSQVESQNYEIRKNVLKYDEVLNRQRTVIYDERRKVLEGADLHEQIRNMVDDAVEGYVYAACGEGYPEEWDLEQLWTALGTLYPVGIALEEIEADRSILSAEYLAEELKGDAQAAYDTREAALGVGPTGEPVMRELERRVLLSVMDRKWREHLYEMDYLQEGIGLRAMGQRDPLVEYQREGFDMFNAMMEAIKEESVGFLFNVEVQVEQAAPAPTLDLSKVVATGPGEQPGEVMAESLLADEPAALVQEARSAIDGARAADPDDVPPAFVPAVQSPPQPEVAPVGVAGEPVPSQAPAAFVDEPSVAPEAPPVPATAPQAVTVLPEGFGRPERPTELQYTAPALDGDGGVVTSTQATVDGDPAGEVTRNAPCPCGSGKKYNRCHGAAR
ncbi:MAG: protein translocase subunit secA [Frankiales bacterium]|nr:protein translocase subunit secA [Frankiales bacterium]